VQSSHHPAFYIYCLYAFPYSIRFLPTGCHSHCQQTATRPSLYQKNLYCCIGMAGLDRLFSFPLPIFRLLLPILLSVLPHFPSPMAAAELTPIACGPDCPLLFLLSYSSQNPQAFLYSYFTRILFTIANSFPSVFTLIKEDSAALCPFLIYIALSTHFHFNIFFQIFILLINPLLKLLGAMRTKLLKDGSLTRLLFYNYLKSSPSRISQVPVFSYFHHS